MAKRFVCPSCGRRIEISDDEIICCECGKKYKNPLLKEREQAYEEGFWRYVRIERDDRDEQNFLLFDKGQFTKYKIKCECIDEDVMTEDHRNEILYKLKDKMLFEDYYFVSDALKKCPDRKFDQIILREYKSPYATHAFSLLFGALGIDRFYMGDIAQGIVKLIFCLFSLIMYMCGRFIPVAPLFVFGEILLGIVCFVQLCEIFICFRKTKQNNYFLVKEIIELK